MLMNRMSVAESGGQERGPASAGDCGDAPSSSVPAAKARRADASDDDRSNFPPSPRSFAPGGQGSGETPQGASGSLGATRIGSLGDDQWVYVHCVGCEKSFRKANVQGQFCPECPEDKILNDGYFTPTPTRGGAPARLGCGHLVHEPMTGCPACDENVKYNRIVLGEAKRKLSRGPHGTTDAQGGASGASGAAGSSYEQAPLMQQMPMEVQGQGMGIDSMGANRASGSVGVPAETGSAGASGAGAPATPSPTRATREPRRDPQECNIFTPSHGTAGTPGELDSPRGKPVPSTPQSGSLKTAESAGTQHTFDPYGHTPDFQPKPTVAPGVPRLAQLDRPTRADLFARGRLGGSPAASSYASSKGSRVSTWVCKFNGPRCVGRATDRCLQCREMICAKCVTMCQVCSGRGFCEVCSDPGKHGCRVLFARMEAQERETKLQAELAIQSARLEVQSARAEAARAELSARSSSAAAEASVMRMAESSRTDGQIAGAVADHARREAAEWQRRAEEERKSVHGAYEEMAAKTSSARAEAREVAAEARAAVHGAEERARSEVRDAQHQNRSTSMNARTALDQAALRLNEMQEAMRLREIELEKEMYAMQLQQNNRAEQFQEMMMQQQSEWQTKLERERVERAAERQKDIERWRDPSKAPASAPHQQPNPVPAPGGWSQYYICAVHAVKECVACARALCEEQHFDKGTGHCLHCHQVAANRYRDEVWKAKQDAALQAALSGRPHNVADGAGASGTGAPGTGGSAPPPPPPPPYGSTSEPVDLTGEGGPTIKGGILRKKIPGGGPPGDGGGGDGGGGDDHGDDDEEEEPTASQIGDMFGDWPQKQPPGGGGGGGDPDGGGGGDGEPPPAGGSSGPGGAGGGGGGDPGGGPVTVSVPGQGPNGMTIVVNNGGGSEFKLKIPEFPTVGSLEDWKKLLAREVASCVKDQDEGYGWIMQAIKNEVPDEDLMVSGPNFGRLDMAMSADILRKAQAIRSKANSTNRSIFELANKICMLESTNAGDRLVKGREMVRMIVRHYAVRDAFKQVFTITDLTSLTLNKAGKEADYAFPGWFDMWRTQLARLPVEEMQYWMNPIREHFYDQIMKVEMLKAITQKYQFCRDPENTGEKTYEWMRDHCLEHLDRQRLEKNRADQQKSLQALNKGTPKAAAASGGGGGGADLKKIQCRFEYSKGGCKDGKKCAYMHTHGKGGKGDGKGKGKGGKSKGGKAAPAWEYQPAVPATPGKSKFPCYANSRGKCQTKDCQRDHRPLTEEEKKKRDIWEEEYYKKNGKLPYNYVPKSAVAAEAAAKAAAAAKGAGKGKGKAGAKAKAQAKNLCRAWKKYGKCELGGACKFAHPPELAK